MTHRDPLGRFRPGAPGGPGRPRQRITRFRQALADSTGDGAEMIDELMSIWRDRENPVKERIAALKLGLAYLLGRPESNTSVDVTTTRQLALPARWAEMPRAERELALDQIELLLGPGDEQ